MNVRQLQDLLHYLGYDLTPDGHMGPRTQQALRRFQKDAGLDADGIPGPNTYRALKDAVARDRFSGSQAGTEGFWAQIPYFTRQEFACTCGGRYCSRFPVEPEEQLVRTVNAIRAHFGVPFSPNSAIRCPRRNAEVGGVAHSQHLTGRAADITVPGVDPQTVAGYAETLLPDSGGIGIYSWGVHIDTRPEKARWRG